MERPGAYIYAAVYGTARPQPQQMQKRASWWNPLDWPGMTTASDWLENALILAAALGPSTGLLAAYGKTRLEEPGPQDFAALTQRERIETKRRLTAEATQRARQTVGLPERTAEAKIEEGF